MMWMLVVAFTLLGIWLWQSPFYWYGKGIPWIIPLPVFGNVFGLLYTQVNQFWKYLYNDYKGSGVIGFHFFHSPALVVTHSDVVRQILESKAGSFQSHGFHLNDKIDPLAHNLFFSDGEHWRSVRKKITPFFSPMSLKSMVGVIDESVSSFVTLLDRRRTCVDVHNLSSKLSADIIVKMCFGVESNVFTSKKNSLFLQLLKEDSSKSMSIKVFIGMISPALYDMLQLTFFSRGITSSLTEFVADIVKSRSSGVGVRPDFIQSMIMQMSQHTKAEIDEVTAQSAIMLLAGTETTAHSIAFMLHELAVNQSVQDKLRSEISYLLDSTGGKCTYEQINSLKYTNLVINETLRKYPPIGSIVRQCTADTSLTVLGKEVPVKKGTRIFIPTLGFQRDSELYPTPHCFLPERNIGPYFPFGLGPRSCVGMRLATLEMAYLLVKIIPHYILEPCLRTKDPIPLDPSSPMVAPRGGVWLQAVPL